MKRTLEERLASAHEMEDKSRRKAARLELLLHKERQKANAEFANFLGSVLIEKSASNSASLDLVRSLIAESTLEDEIKQRFELLLSGLTSNAT